VEYPHGAGNRFAFVKVARLELDEIDTNIYTPENRTELKRRATRKETRAGLITALLLFGRNRTGEGYVTRGRSRQGL
jgi:hypothetical protein